MKGKKSTRKSCQFGAGGSGCTAVSLFRGRRFCTRKVPYSAGGECRAARANRQSRNRVERSAERRSAAIANSRNALRTRFALCFFGRFELLLVRESAVLESAVLEFAVFESAALETGGSCAEVECITSMHESHCSVAAEPDLPGGSSIEKTMLFFATLIGIGKSRKALQVTRTVFWFCCSCGILNSPTVSDIFRFSIWNLKTK